MLGKKENVTRRSFWNTKKGLISVTAAASLMVTSFLPAGTPTLSPMNVEAANSTTIGTLGDSGIDGMTELNYYVNETAANIYFHLDSRHNIESTSPWTAQVDIDDPNTAANPDITLTEDIYDIGETIVNVDFSAHNISTDTEYGVTLTVFNENNLSEWQGNDTLLRLNPPAAGTTLSQVDQNRGIMIVDEQPFFPIGAFGTNQDNFQAAKEAGFNLTTRWKNNTTERRIINDSNEVKYEGFIKPGDSGYSDSSQVDAHNDALINNYLTDIKNGTDVNGNHMYVLENPPKLAGEDLYIGYDDGSWYDKYPIINQEVVPPVVNEVKNDPAVIGYYSYDEPDEYAGGVDMQEGVEEYYETIKNLDPYHSVMTLLAVGLSKIDHWDAWDITARDFYPSENTHFSKIYDTAADFAKTARELHDPFIFTPLMQKSDGRSTPLTGDMQRAQTYLGLIGGAKGIFWWEWAPNYKDNWDSMTTVIGEMHDLKDILIERDPEQTIKYRVAGSEKSVKALVKNYNNKSYLIVANAEEAPVTVSFDLPDQYNGLGASIVKFENRNVTVSAQGTFTESFEPYGRHVYELDQTWEAGDSLTLDISAGQTNATPTPLFAPSSANLLVNSSFEEESGLAPGLPVGWSDPYSILDPGDSGHAGGRWGFDDSIPVEHGQQSFRMVRDSNETINDSWDLLYAGKAPSIQQGVGGLDEFTSYNLSVFLKADEPSTAKLWGGWNDDKDCSVTTSWTRCDLEITTGEGETGTFIRVDMLDEGTLWLDAAQITKSSTPQNYVHEGPVADTEAPSTPEGQELDEKVSAVAASSSEIHISWLPSTDNSLQIEEYKIFRDGVEIASTDVTFYADSGLTRSTAYEYEIIAVDAANNQSTATTPVEVVTNYDDNLDANFSDDFENGDSNWYPEKETDTSNPWIINTYAGSQVMDQSDDSSQSGGRLITAGNNTWTDYTVSAKVSRHQYSNKAGIVGRVQSEDHYYQLVINGSDSWSLDYKHGRNSTDWVNLASGQYTPSGSDWEELEMSFIGDKIEATVNGTKVGEAFDSTYTHGKMGLRTEYTAAYFDDVTAVTGELSQDTEDPTAPSSLNASTVSSSQIDLSWNASTDNVGVTGYKIHRSENGSAYTQIDTTSATSYNNTNLTADTPYSYKVQAYDATGNTSSNSNIASATTDPGSSTPFFFDDFENGSGNWTDIGTNPWQIETRNGSQVYGQPTTDAHMGQSITIAGNSTWTDYSVSADVEKIVYHHAGIVGRYQSKYDYYELYIATNEGTEDGIWKLQLNDNGTRTTLDSGDYIGDAANYTLELIFDIDQISAKINGSIVGTVTDSTISNGQIGLRTNPSEAYYDNVLVQEPGANDTEAPSKPSNVSASAISDTEIDVNWDTSTDNVDVVGYKVLRDGVEIDTTSATSYSDTGLTESTLYQYEIIAYDAASNDSITSDPASATTNSSSNQTILFDDDFESGSGNWTDIGINPWQIDTRNGSQVYGQPTTDAHMGQSITIAGNSTWTDYSVSADVEKIVYHHAGILGRYQSSDDYYELYIATNLGTEDGIWKLELNDNGTRTTLDSGDYIGDAANYTLELIFDGNQISAKINGSIVGTVTDSTLSDGQIGLRTNPSEAYYDNVEVIQVGN